MARNAIENYITELASPTVPPNDEKNMLTRHERVAYLYSQKRLPHSMMEVYLLESSQNRKARLEELADVESNLCDITLYENK